MLGFGPPELMMIGGIIALVVIALIVKLMTAKSPNLKNVPMPTTAASSPPDTEIKRNVTEERKIYVTEEKTSGIVMALSVVGFVAGFLGLCYSYIPCLGNFTFYITIPGAIASGIGLLIAKQQNAKSALPIAALTLCLIDIAITFFVWSHTFGS